MNTLIYMLALALLPGLIPVRESCPADEGWVIETDRYDAADYSGVFVGNGSIGLLPWKEPFSVRHLILNDVFEVSGPDNVRTVVKGICPFGLSMSVDGRSVNGKSVGGGTDISVWRQSLEMKHALHRTSFEVPGKVHVEYFVTALRNLPYSLALACRVTALDDVEVEFSNTMAVPEGYSVPELSYRSFMAESRRCDMLCARAVTSGGSHTVASAAMFIHDGSFTRSHMDRRIGSVNTYGSGSAGTVSTDVYPEDRISRRMSKGESAEFVLSGSVCSTSAFSDPLNEAIRQLVYIDRISPSEVLRAHCRLWDGLWQGDIVIEPDMEAQLAVRLALYSLYSSCREGTSLSIPPMGLSSQGYGGHIFWDSELWMFPPMLILNQDIARSMIDYRHDHLDKAKERAAAYGYKGAMYPWESDDNGEESTPVRAITGPMEHHITADVAIAAWNFYCVTRDRQWLEHKGWPVIKAAAEFWTSRAERNPDGSWSIKGVVGADEYANNVTDNAFTNGAASKALECAVKAARVCGKDALAGCGGNAPAIWKEIASGLRILRSPEGHTLEYEGYDGQMIKQADVNLLGYPLGVITDRDQLLKDLAYYEDRIDPENGPAMSYSIFCVQYARLGDARLCDSGAIDPRSTDSGSGAFRQANAMKAEEMFRRCYRPFQRPPFGVISETATSDNPFFTTGAGGLLQAVIFGFGGLEITPRGIVQKKTVLPPSWTRLEIRGAGPDRKTYVVDRSRQ